MAYCGGMGLSIKGGIILFISLICMLPLAALPFYQIETKHTSIIFEELDREHALTIASFADKVYEELAEVLGYEEHRRVPVILTGRSSMANGAFSSVPSRITLYTTADPDLFLTSRSDWLYSLFVHELTHFLHLTGKVGPAAFLTPLFGPEVPLMNAPLMPGWWIEGITTYTETEYAGGGRGTSARFLMPARENPDIIPLPKISYSSINPPKGRIYLGGNILVSYLMETYGEDIYHEINSTFAWFPFTGLGGAVKKVTGTPLKEIYRKALERVGAPSPVQDLQPVFPEEGMYDLVDLREGTLYVQQWNPSSGTSLLSYREGETAVLENLPAAATDDVLSMGKDEKVLYLIFRSYDLHSAMSIKPGSVSFSDIYRYERERSSYTPLTEGAVIRQPALSPDGTKLAAVEAVKDRYRLIELDLKTGRTKTVLESGEGSFLFPSYAPDSSRITGVFVSGGTSSLFIAGEGASGTLIGPVEWEIRKPRFIDEHTISFTSDRDLPFSFYTVDTGSGRIERVLSDPVGILDGLLDREELYYQRYKDGEKRIFRTTIPSGIREEVTFPETTRHEEYPVIHESMYESTRYHDLLRFNLWFPYPILETEVYGIGAYSLFTSLLQRHMLLIMAGYTFNDTQLRAYGEYTYSPGPFSLSFQGAYYSSESTASLSGSIALPLLHLMSPEGTHRSSAQLSGRFIHTSTDEGLLASAGLSYSFSSPSAAADTFGRYRAQGTYSINFLSPSAFASYAAITAATPFVFPHHQIRHTLRAVVSHGNLFSEFTDETGILAPLYITVPASDGYARADYTLSYLIPLALLDIPFGYGGFTGADLSFSATVAAVHDGNSFSLEDEYILSAMLRTTYRLGAGLTLSPFAGAELAPVSGEYGIHVGLGTGSFKTTLPSIHGGELPFL